MKKIRVLHFTVANSGGGVTKFTLRLWKYIDKEKFHFDFVTMSKKLDFAEELEREGCRIYYLSVYAEEDKERFVREVEEILDQGAYDIVHLNTSWWRGFVLEDIARRKGISKVIVHANNTDVFIKRTESREESRKQHFAQRQLLTEDMATDFLACSWDAADWLFGDRIPKEKIEIVPYAIEVEDYKFQKSVRENYRKELGLAEDEYVIGHVGRFEYQKNHEFLIQVFQKITQIEDRARLLLIGIGELEEDIKASVENLGIENKVLFLGKRDDVNGLMQAMDVFAFPSRYEGFGIVLIEAQAAGLQCVVSDQIPEIARITKNIEYLPFSEELWVKKLLEYRMGYEREDMSEVMEKAGFGMNTLAKQMERIYSTDTK